MSWVAIAVGVGGAVVGAVSSKQQADAANRSKTSTTNQTTTQKGNYSEELKPDFRQLMELNRALMEGGPTYIPGGHVTGQSGWPGGGHAGGPGPAPPPETDNHGANLPANDPIFSTKGPTTPNAPADNQQAGGGVGSINPNGVPTTNDVRPLAGASSWYPGGGGGSGDGSASRLPTSGGLPSGASRRPDGRVILASGETQGMTKQDRHRAWEDWKKSRAGMPG